MVILVIGLSIILMACLSIYDLVINEYVYGVGLASFFFIISDYLLVEEKISGRKMTVYALTFVAGIFSLTILPICLMIFPFLYNDISLLSVPLTLFGSGIVLIILGYKSANYKIKDRQLTGKKIERLEKQIILFEKENAELKKTIKLLKYS